MMRFALAVCLSALAAAAVVAASPRPGLKITVRQTTSSPVKPESHSLETTEYIQADRSRTEWRDLSSAGPSAHTGARPMVSITRCDLGRSFTLDYLTRDYDWALLPEFPTRAEWQAQVARATKPTPPGNPTFLIETTTVDTGERKTIFGRTARRVVTTRRQVPIAAPAHGSSENVTDGWYVDLDTHISCDPWFESTGGHASFAVFSDAKLAAMPFLTFKNIGAPETGFLIDGQEKSRSTAVSPDGAETEYQWTSETLVTALAEGPLPAALFEIPAGFRQRPVPLWVQWNRCWERLKGRIWRLF
jgi:hypothetical protein